MATVLEKYWNLRCQVEQMMAQNPSHAGLLWSYGEVIYRIAFWRPASPSVSPPRRPLTPTVCVAIIRWWMRSSSA